MASRTQLRLGQITGSFGDFEGGIVDNLPTAASLAAIPPGSGSLVSAISQLASSVQRIHGGAAFSSQAEGVFAGRIQVDDVTNATSTTDGSLQTDGGLSVTLDAVIGDDLFLKSDGAVLNLGDGNDVTLTHDGGTGATLASAGAFLIDGADTVSIDGASGVNIGTNDSGAAISIGHTTSEVTVNDNLTVTGDLTVNGTTTTVNSTTLTVDDAIILLGQGNNANLKDLGMILERGGNNIALFLDETDDVFKLGLTAETAADDEITVADGVLTTQVDKLQITGSNHFISYENLGGGDTFNIKSSGDFLLDADGGKIMFTDTSAQSTDNIAFVIDIATDQNTKFKDGNESIDFFTLDSANSRIDIDSTILIANGGNSTGGTITFLEDSDNGTNTSVLRGSRSLANNDAVFELPADNGVNGYVLQTDGAGVTSWGSALGDLARFAYKATATVSAGNVDFGSSKTAGIAALAVGTANLNITKADADLNDTLEVYVNGQLLISGSSGGADTDYTYIDADTINFAFGLEADDIIQIIQR